MSKDKKKNKSQGPAHSHSTVLGADGTINVSQSKVQTWRRCRKAYSYKYVEGIVPKRKKRPFMFGGIMHELAEAQFEDGNPFEVLDKIELDNKKLFKKEIEMYGNIISDMRTIMTDYFDHWEGSLKPVEWKGRRSEHEFRIELEDQLWFTGRVDAVVKANKLKWLMEHKTFNRRPGEDDRWRSVQGASYIKALDMVGLHGIDGVLWDYVHSKPPVVPTEKLQNGTFSLKRIDSLPTALKTWVKAEGLKKADYKKLFDEAKANRESRFIRVFSPIRPRVVDNIWNDFVDTSKEIHDLHGKSDTRNIGWNCRMCDYQPLCKAETHDTDANFVRKSLYQLEDLSHKRDENDRDEE